MKEKPRKPTGVTQQQKRIRERKQNRKEGKTVLQRKKHLRKRKDSAVPHAFG